MSYLGCGITLRLSSCWAAGKGQQGDLLCLLVNICRLRTVGSEVTADIKVRPSLAASQMLVEADVRGRERT